MVSHLFVQSKSGDQTAIIGVRYLNKLKTQQRAAVIVEELKLKIKAGIQDMYNLENYTINDFTRIKAVSINMSFDDKNTENVRRDTIVSSQKLKVLVTGLAKKVSTSRASLGLTDMSTINFINFLLLTVGIACFLVVIGDYVKGVTVRELRPFIVCGALFASLGVSMMYYRRL